jgi:hypothetical protein
VRRRADQPAEPVPWVSPARRDAATAGFAALAAVGVLASLLVAAWRLLDHAADLR